MIPSRDEGLGVVMAGLLIEFIETVVGGVGVHYWLARSEYGLSTGPNCQLQLI